MNKHKALGILGLDAKATPADIKSAYRRLARANHPDKMGSAELFKLVQEAYETLEATVKADANRKAKSGGEQTGHREPRSKAEADRSEAKRTETRRRAAERISELQRKIVEATEAKRKAELEYIGAFEADRKVQMGGNDGYDPINETMKTLDAAVETEAQLRVELIHKNADLMGVNRTYYAEQPRIAKEVITAEWNSMPESRRRNDWDYHQYITATVAILGKPYNDNNRRTVILNMSRMFDDGITDLIEGRIELADQDFRAGGFFIWGEYLSTGHYKLAINHYNSALRIKPNVWQIYDSRGHANTKLGYYAEAINDFVAGIECAKHNRSAMRKLQYGIKRAREEANSPPSSSS